MPSARHSLVKWLAASVWYVGAGMLIWKGSGWLIQAARTAPLWPILLAAVALAIGLLRGRTTFRKAVIRNLRRIRELDSPRPWHVFRPWFFLAFVGMGVLAMLMGHLARTGYWGEVVVGSLDLVIGISLFTGAAAHWTWRPDPARRPDRR